MMEEYISVLLIIQLVKVLLKLPYMVCALFIPVYILHIVYYCLVAPRFITEPQSIEASISSAVNLSCSADGFPTPVITWFFQGMNFTSNTVDSANSTFAESTIVITDLMITDGGMYSCEINNVAIVMARTHAVTITVTGGKTYVHTVI